MLAVILKRHLNEHGAIVFEFWRWRETGVSLIWEIWKYNSNENDFLNWMSASLLEVQINRQNSFENQIKT